MQSNTDQLPRLLCNKYLGGRSPLYNKWEEEMLDAASGKGDEDASWAQTMRLGSDGLAYPSRGPSSSAEVRQAPRTRAVRPRTDTPSVRPSVPSLENGNGDRICEFKIGGVASVSHHLFSSIY